jgi:hypothetical protein
MEILNLAKTFSKESDASARQDKLLNEASNYKLASNGGYLHLVKYALFGMLAILNMRLFIAAIPGGWGMLVGLIAVMMEGFAIYCWNNQGKSAGNHRKALIGFCIAFTVVSLAHAAASVYELINSRFPLGPSISDYVFWYSHVVAFPLIFGLQIFALFVIGFTHYQSRISKERAKSQVEIEQGQAELHTQTAQLKQESELAAQRLLFEQEKLKTRMGMTALLKDTLEVESQQMDILRNVSDPTIRARLAQMFGLPDLQVSPQPAASTRQYLTPPPSISRDVTNSKFYTPADNDAGKN